MCPWGHLQGNVKKHPDCGWHHPMGWDYGLNENGERLLAEYDFGHNVTSHLMFLPVWFLYHPNYNQNISLSLKLPLPGILSQHHENSIMQYIHFMFTSPNVEHQSFPLPTPLSRWGKRRQTFTSQRDLITPQTILWEFPVSPEDRGTQMLMNIPPLGSLYSLLNTGHHF